LDSALEQLIKSGLIFRRGNPPDSVYTFKHALTQEVAYGSLLTERREELHERTARQIEALFESRLEDHYGDLAHHYSCSTNRQKAVEYLQLAAQQAVQRSAHGEAINHLTRALAILRALPDTPRRAQQELALQMTLGPVLIATKGNGAVEVGAVYKRALELGRQVGQDTQLFSVLFGLRSFHLVRGELHPAFELAQQLMSVAKSVQESGLLVEAHLAQGSSLFLFGRFIPALEHMERAIALYDPQKHHVHAFVYGIDPGVFSLGRSAWILATLGHLDQASKKVGETLALAHQQSHAFSLAIALVLVSPVHTLRGEWAALQQTLEAAIAICTGTDTFFCGNQPGRVELIEEINGGMPALDPLAPYLVEAGFVAGALGFLYAVSTFASSEVSMPFAESANCPVGASCRYFWKASTVPATGVTLPSAAKDALPSKYTPHW
jgi:tetratricopeptide (TPR) repeat protein